MTERSRDEVFKELLESPLEDDGVRWGSRWWPLIAGLAAGGLATAIVVAFAGGGSEVIEPPSTTVSPTTRPVEPIVDPAALYPPAFREVTDGVALAPLAGVQLDDALFLSVGTAVARNVDEPAVRFNGGRWQLVTTDGTRLPASSVIFQQLVPSTFSLRFDGVAGAAVDHLHLVERWTTEIAEVAADLDVPTLPFALAEPMEIQVTDGVTLQIVSLELDLTGGRIAWVIPGVETLAGGAVVRVEVVDDAGRQIESFYPISSSGFFVDDSAFIVGGPPHGSSVLGRGSGAELPAGSTLRIAATIPLLRTIPASLDLDLAGLTIEQR